MKILFAILMISTSLIAEAQLNCKKDPICCQIQANKPDVSSEYAMHLSNLIKKYVDKYKLDSNIFTAIITQESMFKLNAVNCYVGLVKLTDIEKKEAKHKCSKNKCNKRDLKYKKTKACFDFGLTQINISTIEAYKFDLERLTTDLEYSVHAGAIILNDIQKQWRKLEPHNYWSRYNTSTPSKRQEYERVVKRWFRKHIDKKKEI